MGHGKLKDVLTTGQVAKICNVAPRTVSKWFDSGQLRGYRIPGSKDRRIPLSQLIRFMKAHNIPLDGLETGTTRVLIVDDEQELSKTLAESLQKEAEYEVMTASNAFEAGVLAERFRPHVILMDAMLNDVSGKEVCSYIHNNSDLQGTRIIALTGQLAEGECQALLQQGFDAYLKKPFEVREVIRAIENDMAIVY